MDDDVPNTYFSLKKKSSFSRFPIITVSVSDREDSKEMVKSSHSASKTEE